MVVGLCVVVFSDSLGVVVCVYLLLCVLLLVRVFWIHSVLLILVWVCVLGICVGCGFYSGYWSVYFEVWVCVRDLVDLL